MLAPGFAAQLAEFLRDLARRDANASVKLTAEQAQEWERAKAVIIDVLGMVNDALSKSGRNFTVQTFDQKVRFVIQLYDASSARHFDFTLTPDVYLALAEHGRPLWRRWSLCEVSPGLVFNAIFQTLLTIAYGR